MRLKATIILFLLSFNHVLSQQVINWKNDIDYLMDELPSRDNYLFSQWNRWSFRNELKQLEVAIPALSNAEIVIRLQQILVKAHDSHTFVYYQEYLRKELPVYTYWFDDGLYILQTDASHENILGNRLTAINGYPVSRIFDSLKSLIVQDNEALNKYHLPDLLCYKDVLNYFSFSKPGFDIRISYIDSFGDERTTTFNENDRYYDLVTIKPEKLYPTAPNIRLLFWGGYIEKDSIYYIQYNECNSEEMQILYGSKSAASRLPSFYKFEENTLKELAEKPVKKLVFDVRYNQGGYSQLGKDFVMKLKKVKSINQKGKLFVIVGRKTFSSAVVNTYDFKYNTKAIIIGEETSGKPNFFAGIHQMVLPNSGLNIQYSTQKWNNTNNSRQTIKPDIMVTKTFSDYLNGNDTYYQAVVNYK